jgi:hypothetical protein
VQSCCYCSLLLMYKLAYEEKAIGEDSAPLSRVIMPKRPKPTPWYQTPSRNSLLRVAPAFCAFLLIVATAYCASIRLAQPLTILGGDADVYTNVNNVHFSINVSENSQQSGLSLSRSSFRRVLTDCRVSATSARACRSCIPPAPPPQSPHASSCC